MARKGWFKPVVALVLIIAAVIVISNSISTGNVVTLTGSECRGVDGASGKILILPDSWDVEGLKAEAEDKAKAWQIGNVEECERQQDDFITKCGNVFNECRTLGANECREVNNRKDYNCLDYLPTYQECEITSETAYRSTWHCEISRVDVDLGSCTCEK